MKTSYDRNVHPDQAYELARTGMTNEGIARALGISLRTLYYWMRRHQEFARAIEQARPVADVRVARALYSRTQEFEQIITITDRVDGKVVRTREIRRIVPPDPIACLRYLERRRPDEWASTDHQSKEDQEKLTRLIEAMEAAAKSALVHRKASADNSSAPEEVEPSDGSDAERKDMGGN